jgi:hypothetical protein
MHRAIERGLSVADFENMSLGMVIDYLITCQNEEQKTRTDSRQATEADIDSF